jgi:hypothetical protein
MHKPERRGVEDEPHLIGGRVMARHAGSRRALLTHRARPSGSGVEAVTWQWV